MPFSTPATWLDHNPNLREVPFIPLNAFNLREGAAFMSTSEPDPRVWITERVTRDENFERVYVWAHDGTHHNKRPHPGLSEEKAFDLHYCDSVALIGLVVNPQNPDDNDWGN